jgi:hypothetical protein
MIRVPAQDNAYAMLEGQAVALGLGDGGVRYFVLDGKVWCIDSSDEVYRSDDSAESNEIMRSFRNGNSGRHLYKFMKENEPLPRGEVALTLLEANWLKIALRNCDIPFTFADHLSEHSS